MGELKPAAIEECIRRVNVLGSVCPLLEYVEGSQSVEESRKRIRTALVNFDKDNATTPYWDESTGLNSLLVLASVMVRTNTDPSYFNGPGSKKLLEKAIREVKDYFKDRTNLCQEIPLPSAPLVWSADEINQNEESELKAMNKFFINVPTLNGKPINSMSLADISTAMEIQNEAIRQKEGLSIKTKAVNAQIEEAKKQLQEAVTYVDDHPEIWPVK